MTFRDIVSVTHVKGRVEGIMLGPLSRTIKDEQEYSGDDNTPGL